MPERVRHSLMVIGLCTLVGVLTWLFSLLVQYVCSITIEGETFHPTSHPSSRLAVATVLSVVVVIIAIEVILEMNGWVLFFVWIICAGTVLSCIVWVAVHVFPGTTVSTTPAQVIYGILTALWGVMWWYVFIGPEAE